VPLTPGTRISSLVVDSLVGSGGMGEVYRAHDTRLDRDVALKVLPALFAADPERLERFEREARLLAALNHPNIAQVFAVLEEPPALVMELVDGEDLAQRLAGGPMPLQEAIAASRQIAEALEAAHESGIIHRDLKPANIKIRSDDTVKVLDFGLAKVIDPAASSVNAAQSPTLTAAATQLGTVVGTAAYMAPEQARGKAVDRRADIWAFGCVLYEMLTATQLFQADSISETISAILRDEPDLTKLPATTPPAVRGLLTRCLEKDPKQRLRDIGEARLLLSDPQRVFSAPAAIPAVPRKTARARWWSWASIALAFAAIGIGAGYLWRPAADVPLRKSYVALQQDGNAVSLPVLSPDGKRVVYRLRSRLWVQSLEEWTPRELPGTEGGSRPFWSHDSAWIAFFRAEQLLKVPAAGGPVVSVAALPAVQAPLDGNSGVWMADGSLIISQASGRSLYKVSSGGGEPREFFKLQDAIGVDLHDVAPLPGGAFVAAVHRQEGVNALGVLSNGTLSIVLEVPNVSGPQYSPSGHLVFVRQSPDANLWAVPFDVKQSRVTGEPFLIGGGSDLSVGRDGTLLYRAGPQQIVRQLTWFTLDGRTGTVIAPPQEWIEGVALSPDRRRLLASASDGIWIYEVATGARSRLTTGRSDITPQWIGTTGEVVFVRSNNGRPDLVIKGGDPGAPERVLAENARFPTLTSDGRRLVFNQRAANSRLWQVVWVDLARPAELHRLGGAHMGARFPAVSPDGRFVAYVSGEIGRDHIFLTRLPDGNGKWQLSSDDGGGWCRFSGPGDAVVYRTPGGDFMSVPVSGASDPSIGRAQRLFEWNSGWAPFYELTPDGKSGITAMPLSKTTTGMAALSLVQNWHLEFAGR
jgi:eukaryotic-like serine/threonine-protein kinase